MSKKLILTESQFHNFIKECVRKVISEERVHAPEGIIMTPELQKIIDELNKGYNPIDELDDDPVNDPVDDPVNDPDDDPVDDPVNDPVDDPVDDNNNSVSDNNGNAEMFTEVADGVYIGNIIFNSKIKNIGCVDVRTDEDFDICEPECDDDDNAYGDDDDDEGYEPYDFYRRGEDDELPTVMTFEVNEKLVDYYTNQFDDKRIWNFLPKCVKLNHGMMFDNPEGKTAIKKAIIKEYLKNKKLENNVR